MLFLLQVFIIYVNEPLYLRFMCVGYQYNEVQLRMASSRTKKKSSR